ncbi:MAG: glycosyltransferase family 4 protein [Rhodospirillales bacterium]|nr:glycosyltransferase family 4 protein [Acetobacter sp.]
MKTFCYLVERLGPYHIARLDRTAADTDLEVHALELDPGSQTYAWEAGSAGERPAGFTRHPLPGRRDAKALRRILNTIRPAVVFLNGWADWGALQGLAWCLERGVPAVVMSDSQERDERRVIWKEAIKRRFVQCCQAAFVAGRRHAEYVARLGLPARQIITGYDVVDNDHFSRGAEEARVAPTRRPPAGLPGGRPYFLCVSRCVPKKNLPALLRAYLAYRRRCNGWEPWDLIVLGDGEGRRVLESQIAADGLAGCVHLPGFRQYDELPAYYGLASALVLASTTDQWGLAVNEAMAAGLPVLVSVACGCVPELVHETINGFTFEPSDESALAEILLKIASTSPDVLASMGAASQRIIANWSLSRFADSVQQAVQLAMSRQRTKHRVRNLVRCAAFRGLALLR